MRKERNMFQIKEQDKISEKDLNETEIVTYSRVQGNGHEDSHSS